MVSAQADVHCLLSFLDLSILVETHWTKRETQEFRFIPILFLFLCQVVSLTASAHFYSPEEHQKDDEKVRSTRVCVRTHTHVHTHACCTQVFWQASSFSSLK